MSARRLSFSSVSVSITHLSAYQSIQECSRSSTTPFAMLSLCSLPNTLAVLIPMTLCVCRYVCICVLCACMNIQTERACHCMISSFSVSSYANTQACVYIHTCAPHTSKHSTREQQLSTTRPTNLLHTRAATHTHTTSTCTHICMPHTTTISPW